VISSLFDGRASGRGKTSPIRHDVIGTGVAGIQRNHDFARLLERRLAPVDVPARIDHSGESSSRFIGCAVQRIDVSAGRQPLAVDHGWYGRDCADDVGAAHACSAFGATLESR